MFSQILVPLDGAAESKVVLPLARSLAGEPVAKITLLRVVPQPLSLSERAVFNEDSELLRRAADELSSGGIQVESAIRQGQVVDEILQQRRDQAADLIVMPTHGRAGLARAVLGSITERVLAESGVPLLLVGPGSRRVTHLRRLLVPIDGSPGAAIALGTAMGLVKTSGAAMSLLQVAVPIPAYVYGTRYVDPDWNVEALASARSYVEAMAKRLQRAHILADGEARLAPHVAETIVETADQVEADLIVMSTHALRGPARALLGSVADAVVRSAHCPVLLVRREHGTPAADSTTETQATPSLLGSGSSPS
jgi:nucleotide-binding universal stress UspA family protein